MSLKRSESDADTNHTNKWSKLLSFGVMYRIIDSILLFIVLSIQNCTISYYMTYYNDGKSIWYFFFFADFVLVFLFMCGSMFASRHYRKLHLLKSRRIRCLSSDANHESRDCGRSTRSPKHGILNISFPRQMGTLPLLWINWILYSLLLSIKIFILHLQEIALALYKSTVSSDSIIAEPHTIKLCLASMTIVFLLWIELHRNHNNSRSQLCVKELTTSIVFEIFDSIDLLDLLLPESVNDISFTRSFIPEWLSIIILILVTFNLLLPTIGLFRLSQSNFDSHKLGLKMNIIHNSLRICLINIPYMLLRIYFWITAKREISIFLLKNALSIFVSIRHMISDVNELRKLKASPKRRNSLTEENELPLSVLEANKSSSHNEDHNQQ